MSLQDIEIRDGLVAWMSPGTLNINELSDEVQELFCGLEMGWGEEHTATGPQSRLRTAVRRP